MHTAPVSAGPEEKHQDSHMVKPVPAGILQRPIPLPVMAILPREATAMYPEAAAMYPALHPTTTADLPQLPVQVTITVKTAPIQAIGAQALQAATMAAAQEAAATAEVQAEAATVEGAVTAGVLQAEAGAALLLAGRADPVAAAEEDTDFKH